ncbi:hypothetical protein GIB67_004048 [Kingdonia uniflora]|uniref:RING-type domain-containing protein n=1 Tax=Kingdonia uniflora TaxID=39325 RepID=A0A7J7NR50_9MAGN|nr:hypothetical protein GIB67_004048 [Kingdonia uniflora]
MSITPTQLQRSATTTNSSSQITNPSCSNHGFLHQQSQPQLFATPISTVTQTLESAQISNHPDQISGSVSSVGEAFGGSSAKVNEVRERNPRRGSHRRSRDTSCYTGQGGLSSQFNGELSGATTSSPQSQPTSVSFGSNSSSVRRNQMMNANHLLNFQFDRIARPQPRNPPPRKPIRIRPYNKDLFLQANFKFVVLDSGNNSTESMDPDKMLQWENVICVKYSTPFPVQCPICLDSPLCAQITSCGHIFCFPCILQYLLMGVEDDKINSWKKCPLCFMMISQKDLYTIYIENVKHYSIGDTVPFTLLSRPKDSLITSQRNQRVDDVSSDNVDHCDPFSKFSITTDVNLSVREAFSELNDWVARADSGLVDNLEQLPYVCTALEQLELRKKCWTETRDLSSSPPSVGGKESKSAKCLNSHKLDWNPIVQTDLVPEMLKDERNALSSSYEEEKRLQGYPNGSGQMSDKDSYTFYQAVDGQHLILHPLNMKCLLHHYGSYDSLPPRISGEVVQLETVTQSEAMRRRYRYLSHFSLTTTFQLCEINICKFLPPESLYPFMDEIQKRENQRKQLAKREHREKVKADAAAMQEMHSPSNYVFSSYTNSKFSIDDFAALGNAPLASTSPPVTSERKLFSNVTRLGFAAAHDSPSLGVEESGSVPTYAEDRGGTSEAGERNTVTLSFANVISTTKPSESVKTPKVNGFPGKKGKKPSRVLLSTAGGRHY